MLNRRKTLSGIRGTPMQKVAVSAGAALAPSRSVQDTTGRHPLKALRADKTGVIRHHGPAIDTARQQLVALPHGHLIGAEEQHVGLTPFYFSRILPSSATRRLNAVDSLDR